MCLLSHPDTKCSQCILEGLLCPFNGCRIPFNCIMSMKSTIDRNLKMCPNSRCFSVAFGIQYSSRCLNLICTSVELNPYCHAIPWYQWFGIPHRKNVDLLSIEVAVCFTDTTLACICIWRWKRVNPIPCKLMLYRKHVWSPLSCRSGHLLSLYVIYRRKYLRWPKMHTALFL